MKPIDDILREDRRLVILRVLANVGYTCNESVLHDALESLGHRVSRDLLNGDLSWLDEQGLLRLEVVGQRVVVAHLTERGGDVASGRAKHPYVKRPSPGSAG